MIALRPKLLFQTNEAVTKQMAGLVEGDNFQTFLSFALAEFVTQTTPSAEQVSAVRAFIAVTLNLPLKEEAAPNVPIRSIDHSLLRPPAPPKQPPK